MPLYKYILQESRHFDSAFLQCLPIWKALQHFFHQSNSSVLLQCNSTKYPCKHGILWSYSLLYRILLHMPLQYRKQQFLKGSHHLITKRVCRYNNHRYYRCTGNLRNWWFTEIEPCTLYPLYGIHWIWAYNTSIILESGKSIEHNASIISKNCQHNHEIWVNVWSTFCQIFIDRSCK